jgi:hypothetical protein
MIVPELRNLSPDDEIAKNRPFTAVRRPYLCPESTFNTVGALQVSDQPYAGTGPRVMWSTSHLRAARDCAGDLAALPRAATANCRRELLGLGGIVCKA